MHVPQLTVALSSHRVETLGRCEALLADHDLVLLEVHRHIERLEQGITKTVGSKQLAGFLATAAAIEAAAADDKC